MRLIIIGDTPDGALQHLRSVIRWPHTASQCSLRSASAGKFLAIEQIHPLQRVGFEGLL